MVYSYVRKITYIKNFKTHNMINSQITPFLIKKVNNYFLVD